MVCSNCHQPIEVGAAFCGNCGAPIMQAAAATGGPAVPMVSAPQAAAPLPQPVAPVPVAPVAAPMQPTQPVTAQPPQPVGQSQFAQVYQNQAAVPAQPMTVGQPNAYVPAAPIGIPSYAVPIAGQQNSELKAAMALVCAILGIVGGLFIPILGIALGIAGFVLASLSKNSHKKTLRLIAMIFASLAIVIGIASWAYAIAHDSRLTHKTNAATSSSSSPEGISGPTVSGANVSTPCYTISFPMTLNIQNASGSCNMDAYNGSSLDASSNAFKVYGTASSVTSADFNTLAKSAIEKDISENLPTFTVSNEYSGTFAGSQAYFVNATNGSGVSIIEACVLHQTSNGDNFFVLVHAQSTSSVTLDDMQKGWQWQ